MVNLGTSAAGSIPPSANEVVVESQSRGAGRAGRSQRIQQLRVAIENGQYSVSACDLADAVLRSARQAN